jgi:hypothetical protein
MWYLISSIAETIATGASYVIYQNPVGFIWSSLLPPLTMGVGLVAQNLFEKVGAFLAGDRMSSPSRADRDAERFAND